MVTRAAGVAKGSGFARGDLAVAECPLCSQIVPYKTLARDWRGVWVCPDCDDDPPAALKRAAIPVDAEGLHHAHPFLDDYPPEDNVDEFQPMNERPTFE